MSTHEAKPKAHTLESVSSNDYTPSPMTFSQKTKAHFKRFWWLHLIVFLIGVLIITLCVYVAILTVVIYALLIRVGFSWACQTLPKKVSMMLALH
jgi:uncharacterized membrane protein